MALLSLLWATYFVYFWKMSWSFSSCMFLWLTVKFNGVCNFEYTLKTIWYLRDARYGTRHTRINKTFTYYVLGTDIHGTVWHRVYRNYLGLCYRASSVFVHERNDRMMNEPWTNVQWTWSITVRMMLWIAQMISMFRSIWKIYWNHFAMNETTRINSYNVHEKVNHSIVIVVLAEE